MSRLTEGLARFVESHRTLYKAFLLIENAIKKPVLGCKSCGQCVLSYNAFTCCMRCPKQLRNGPCGGTRPDGTCEVDPTQPCIWHLIYTRSVKLGREKKLLKYHVPVDHRLERTSALVNWMAGRIEGMSLRADLPEAPEPPSQKRASGKPASFPAESPRPPKVHNS